MLGKSIVLLFSFVTIFSHAASVNVKDRILAQDFYLSTYEDVFGHAEYALNEKFIEIFQNLNSSKSRNTLKLVNKLESKVPSKLLRPIVYWSVIKPNKKKLKNVISFLLVYKALTIRDYIDSPLTQSKVQAKDLLKELTGHDSSHFGERVIPELERRAQKISKLHHSKIADAILSEKIVAINFKTKIPGIKNYVLSYLGLVPGNKVELVSENKRDENRIDWFNDRVIFNGGTLDWNAPYIKMPTKEDPTGHPVFLEDPIYIKIKDMIASAQDSIFIDIFLFGGTLGATLTEYLIDQTLEKRKKNPNFKTLLLHDYATNYNMLGEMMPIFKYIKKRIDTEPEVKKSVMLLQANIHRHPPGIPFGITSIIPKDKETCKFMESKSTYYESKIDHSKVIVVDANTDNPQAYFGSKNWTDHSGGYYYDDAIYVNGPSAALVQASYYRDIEAALTDIKKEKDCFYFKEMGLDNVSYLPKKKEILNWFKIKKDTYPIIGDQVVRIAEADVDGTIKNTRNILIDMIMNAKSHIYMEQLFMYDPYINSALIKKKIQNPDIKIQILADHNGNFGLNGLPNTIFMKELIDAGIEIKARETFGKAFVFPNGYEQEFHQENHRKITSIDGKILLGGSSNLNPDTLQGSFREFGAQIFDTKEISRFEKAFEKDWSDSSKTKRLDIENFQAILAGKKLSKKESALINGTLRTILNNKDKIEGRY